MKFGQTVVFSHISYLLLARGLKTKQFLDLENDAGLNFSRCTVCVHLKNICAFFDTSKISSGVKSFLSFSSDH
jgi:hypothetical protein